MGVNIGISVISMIVVLGYIYSKDEYGYVISVVIVYDFFNILVVIFLLLFELLIGYFSQVVIYFVVLVFFYDNFGGGFSILGVMIKLVMAWIIDSFDSNVWLVLGFFFLLLLIFFCGFFVVLCSFLIGKL